MKPTVEYPSTVWSPHQEELRHDIEMVQRRGPVDGHIWNKGQCYCYASRAIMGYPRTAEVKSMHLYGVPHHTQFGDQLNKKEESAASTRGHDTQFIQLDTKRNYCKHSFFPEMIPLWLHPRHHHISDQFRGLQREAICSPHQNSIQAASSTNFWFKHILFMTEHDKGLGRAKKAIFFLLCPIQ